MANKCKLLEYTVFIFCIFHFGRSEEGLENHCKDIFDKCECTDYYIYCDNQGLTDITLLRPYINTTVTSIIVKGNDFKELPIDLFHACTDTLPYLKNLDLSSNSIEVIHVSSFDCLDQLEKLSLRNNSLRVDSFLSNFRISTTSLKRLNLSVAFNDSGYMSSKQLAGIFKKDGLTTVERLDLSGNNIPWLNYDAGTALCDLFSLKYLDLSNNNVANPMLRECMTRLEVLDLSYNSITHLTPSLMDSIEALPQLTEARLDNNPYVCDCSIQGMVDWLNSTEKPINKNRIICSQGESSVIGLPVWEITNVSKLECLGPNIPTTCFGYLARSSLVYILVASGVLLTVTVLVVVLLIRRRRQKRAGRVKVKTQDSPDDGPPYKLIV